MKIYSIDGTNCDNFTSVAPKNLICELSLSNQFALGAVVADGELSAGEPLTVNSDQKLSETDHAAGLIIYYVNPINFRVIIKWLYVADEFEGRGIGKELLEAVINVATVNKSPEVVVSLPEIEFNADLVEYFEEYGFEYSRKSSQMYFCSLYDILDNVAFADKTLSKSVRSMRDDSGDKLARFIYTNTEVFSDELALEPADLVKNADSILCDPDLNCEYVDENGDIRGCFILVNNSANSVSPIFICNSNKKEIQVFEKMILFAAAKALKKYGDELEIMVRVATPQAKELAKRLLGENMSIDYSEYVLKVIE